MSQDRQQLLRDALTFHGKLFVDGMKDFAIFWLSIGAAMLDFIFHTKLFYRVLGLSRRFDGALGLHRH